MSKPTINPRVVGIDRLRENRKKLQEFLSARTEKMREFRRALIARIEPIQRDSARAKEDERAARVDALLLRAEAARLRAEAEKVEAYAEDLDAFAESARARHYEADMAVSYVRAEHGQMVRAAIDVGRFRRKTAELKKVEQRIEAREQVRAVKRQLTGEDIMYGALPEWVDP